MPFLPSDGFRDRLYRQLDLDAWHERGVSPLNRLILLAVAVSIVIAALHTEPTLESWNHAFRLAMAGFAALFTAEYVARLWVKPLNPRYRGRWGWLVYATRWHALIDLLAVAAIWIELALGAPGAWAAMLRLARILRIFTLTEDSPVGIATRAIVGAISDRRTELMLAVGLGIIALMSFAIALYHLEGEVQPETFGSIPRAMWWAVATLTTVGYGDAVPVTPLGQVVGGLAAISSIALVALPAGIMAAAFSDAFRRAREAAKERGPDA